MSEDTTITPAAAGELLHFPLASPLAALAHDLVSAMNRMVEAEKALSRSMRDDEVAFHRMSVSAWLTDAERAWDDMIDALRNALAAPRYNVEDRILHMMLRHVQTALRAEVPVAFSDALELAIDFAALVESSVDDQSSLYTAPMVRTLAATLGSVGEIDMFRENDSCIAI